MNVNFENWSAFACPGRLRIHEKYVTGYTHVRYISDKVYIFSGVADGIGFERTVGIPFSVV